MADIEKVIKGLEICSEHGSWHGLDCEHNEAYKDCPYRGCETGCIVTIAKDAFTLLKEQDNLLRKKQKDINKLQADYAELRHKFLKKTQIVRCKDCKHYENSGWFTQCFRHNGISPDVNWFCADGVKRDE